MTTPSTIPDNSAENPTCTTPAWPLPRILFLLAGTVTLTGLVLGVFVNHWFLLLPAIAGANQLLMVAVGWCPMSLLLTRYGIGADRLPPSPGALSKPELFGPVSDGQRNLTLSRLSPSQSPGKLPPLVTST